MDQIEEKIAQTRDAIEEKHEQVQRAVQAGREAAQQAREDLERRLSETKAAYNAGAQVARDARTVRAERAAERAASPKGRNASISRSWSGTAGHSLRCHSGAMWMIELAMKTTTADSRIGIQSAAIVVMGPPA